MGIRPYGIGSKTALVKISVAIISWCVGASEMITSITPISGAATTVGPAPSRSIASVDCEFEDDLKSRGFVRLEFGTSFSWSLPSGAAANTLT